MPNNPRLSPRTARTADDFARMAAALYINPEAGTVRHARAIPSAGILKADDAGTPNNGSWRIVSGGVQASRAQLIWFAATGEVPARLIRHMDGNALNDAFSNLSVSAFPVGVRKQGAGYCAALQRGDAKYYSPVFTTAEEAAAARAAMLKLLDAA